MCGRGKTVPRSKALYRKALRAWQHCPSSSSSSLHPPPYSLTSSSGWAGPEAHNSSPSGMALMGLLREDPASSYFRGQAHVLCKLVLPTMDATKEPGGVGGEAPFQGLSTLLPCAPSAAQTSFTPWGHFSDLLPLLHHEVEVCLPSPCCAP